MAPESGSAEIRRDRVGEGSDRAALQAAVEAAFDYRGDVTVELEGGAELVGYVFNRDASRPEPFLEILPADGGAARTVLYRSVRSIVFSGRDAASRSGRIPGSPVTGSSPPPEAE